MPINRCHYATGFIYNCSLLSCRSNIEANLVIFHPWEKQKFIQRAACAIARAAKSASPLFMYINAASQQSWYICGRFHARERSAQQQKERGPRVWVAPLSDWDFASPLVRSLCAILYIYFAAWTPLHQNNPAGQSMRSTPFVSTRARPYS